ncbi:hypothetical protein C0Q70_04877 [Pomacea canaliculata]|uniref:MAM domain-containing protein n=1 Tax=Pomacea canaliculata TaxID=400727 RepID=A0A2T7PJK6_POMCA|nr:hypothetical protein C0Q70_04877 [Pomacea canaliculata]
MGDDDEDGNNDNDGGGGGYQHTEDGFPLQDVDTPQNHDTLYAVVHKPNRGHQVNPRTDPDVLMQTGCDRPVQRQIYDNVAADKGNVLPPPIVGTPSQSLETSDDILTLKLTSMAATVPFISVAMTFGCVLLFGYVTRGDREICYQGFTGLDSGGSCTFNKGHRCDWTSIGVRPKWEVNKNGEAFADMLWIGQGDRATLISPWMCEDNFTTICVQFHFMFDDPEGGRLTLKKCDDTRTCEDLWFANSGDKEKWSWYNVSETITLTHGNRFQIQFEGERIEDSFFRETNFYLDNIVYKNFSCAQKTPLIISSSTRNPLTSQTVTTETYNNLSTVQTVETSDDILALKLTSMAAIVPFISVAMTFGCVLLFGCVTLGDSEICHQGFTGLDSGEGEAFANMYRTNQRARATLISPWMCEDNFTTICVQFDFKFDDPDGGRLTLKLCHDTETCEDLWFANSADKYEWSWYHVSETITLTQGNRFQIQIEGSCTFSSSGFCNYRWSYYGAKWEVNNNREAFVNMHGKDKGHRAVLTSPWMCGDNISTICIQFNFMFNRRDGGRLTLKLCHDTTGCHVVWFATSGDRDEWKWQQARENIALTNRGQFQIQFEAMKTYDHWLYTETDFYLDNIVYINASCFTDSASAPPPTSDHLLPTSDTAPNMLPNTARKFLHKSRTSTKKQDKELVASGKMKFLNPTIKPSALTMTLKVMMDELRLQEEKDEKRRERSITHRVNGDILLLKLHMRRAVLDEEGSSCACIYVYIV